MWWKKNEITIWKIQSSWLMLFWSHGSNHENFMLTLNQVCWKYEFYFKQPKFSSDRWYLNNSVRWYTGKNTEYKNKPTWVKNTNLLKWQTGQTSIYIIMTKWVISFQQLNVVVFFYTVSVCVCYMHSWIV